MANATTDGILLYRILVNELKTHLLKRAEYHVKRNEELVAKGKAKNDEINSKVDESETTSDRMAYKGSSTYNEAQRERDNYFMLAREHAKKSLRFTFLAEHWPIPTVDDGSFVNVCESELVALEFFQ